MSLVVVRVSTFHLTRLKVGFFDDLGWIPTDPGWLTWHFTWPVWRLVKSWITRLEALFFFENHPRYGGGFVVGSLDKKRLHVAYYSLPFQQISHHFLRFHTHFIPFHSISRMAGFPLTQDDWPDMFIGDPGEPVSWNRLILHWYLWWVRSKA